MARFSFSTSRIHTKARKTSAPLPPPHHQTKHNLFPHNKHPEHGQKPPLARLMPQYPLRHKPCRPSARQRPEVQADLAHPPFCVPCGVFVAAVGQESAGVDGEGVGEEERAE